MGDYPLGGSSIIKGLTKYIYQNNSLCFGSYITESYSDQCKLQSDVSSKDDQSYISYSTVSVKSSSSSEGDDGLPAGVIAGIVIAVVFSVAFIIFSGVIWYNNQNQGHQKVVAKESPASDI